MVRQALEGLKVADFGWAGVGPIISNYLAVHGAEVVKVESSTRLDVLRQAPPYKDGKPGVNRSGFFANINSNKYSITLNLSTSQGMEIAKKLVAWCDVAVENFTPGVMARMGLGYEELKKVKPDIIMVSTSMMGQTGPQTQRPGQGAVLTPLAGFTHFTGWPDAEPGGTAIAYSDWVAPPFAIAAIMAALDYRRRTGRGQYIDQSQFESGVHFLAPVFLDYSVNKRVQERSGNRCSYASPHGAYRCQGDDRWCAIAVFTDEEWEAFCGILGNPDWTKTPKFATLLGRVENAEEIDRLVEEWTMKHSAEEVMTLMQRDGVPAGVVENGKDIHEDPQLRYRHHFWTLDHPEMGPCAYDGPPFILSETPAELKMPAPCLGEHNEYVCTRILGISDAEFMELLQSEILT